MITRQNLPPNLDPRVAWLPFLVAAGLVLTICFVLLNPASGATLDPAERALFWALHVFPALALLQLAQTCLMRVPGYGRGSVWLWMAGAGVLGAAMFTPLAIWLDAMFGLAGDGSPEAEADETIAGEFANLAPALVVIWLALNAGRMLRLRPVSAHAPNDSTQEQDSDARGAPFWQKVPADLGRDLIALSAELHYLRVRTSRGSDLILYPFGTAVAELDARAVCGMQVHRSHWVGLGHVRRVERIGQRAVCHLSDGSALPISRTFRAALEQAVAARTG